MNKVLQQTLDTICAERDCDWDKSFDCVDALIAHYGEDGFAERVFADVPRTTPFELVADIFNMAIWSTNDNGAEIVATSYRWLKERQDTRKMLVALNLEVIPYKSLEEAREALKTTSGKMSVLIPSIHRAIYAWERSAEKAK